MDNYIWNFHVVDLLLAISLGFMVVDSLTIRLFAMVSLFICLQLQTILIQANRKRGTIIFPIITSILPKKLKDKIAEII